MVRFVELEFDDEDDNVDENEIMSRKKYKILNSTLNTILEFLNDIVRKSSVWGEEVDFLLKSQESRIRTLFNNVVANFKEHLAAQSISYKYESRNYRMLLMSDTKILRSL
ncbi:unnamed protein product [Lactuca saligna]|uniref:Uncharacterized protein n=1 Tax=Lactuca saligna TaxID=75948 RepID=A0AA35Z1Y7_LACSI|nr:unnamed protein product [Lactuca saligna]